MFNFSFHYLSHFDPVNGEKGTVHCMMVFAKVYGGMRACLFFFYSLGRKVTVKSNLVSRERAHENEDSIDLKGVLLRPRLLKKFLD